jgi:hypothetical protein
MPLLKTTSKQLAISAAFDSGYEAGMSNKRCIGWDIDGVPTEAKVLAVMRTLASLTCEDRDDNYAMLWVAGLIAGWFKRAGI